MKFHPDLILKRATGLQVRFLSAAEIEIMIPGGRRLMMPGVAIAVLDVFAYPHTIQQAVNKLPAKGPQHWVSLTNVIKELYTAGALVTDTKELFVPGKPVSFDSSAIHVAMLSDRNRTESFIAAINRVVKKGDVVIDIGTGTGVLAIAAARAGASKVYAIEARSIADVAKETINAIEVAGQITLIH